MAERRLRGSPASPGVAVGAARVLAPATGEQARTQSWPLEVARASAALEAAGAELEATAKRLRAAGRGDEAAMIEAGALMGGDPALHDAVLAAVRDQRLAAGAAILAATAAHAGIIASLPDEHLAARADDVRSFGRRAARLATGEPGDTGASAPEGPRVLVAPDLGPAEVAELEDGVVAIALAGGGATAHAAIVARGLGIPMVVDAGGALLDLADGDELVVDGGRGEVVAAPSAERVVAARAAMAAHARDAHDAGLPAVTRDGRVLRVLTNAAGAAEIRAGLAAGAEGVGLLRTELGFLDAIAWPDEAAHRATLDAAFAAAGPGVPVTVRLLDFGGDKVPPFLRDREERGIALQLTAPDALAAQLAALAGRADTRVLIPLVEAAAQVDAVRAGLPPGTAVGAMVETPEAARRADELAARCDFLSIGTNDLTHATLGTDRFSSGAAPAHHPRVLQQVARVAAAARAAGIPLEVCGEAASDPVAMPLLVGLGVDELSVGAARVGIVRRWVRGLGFAEARELAERALRCDRAEAAARLVRGALGGRLDEPGDAGGEAIEGAARVGAVGTQA
jgi:phosphoenolpyruvate-protein kinase (PTS system EI component)